MLLHALARVFLVSSMRCLQHVDERINLTICSRGSTVERGIQNIPPPVEERDLWILENRNQEEVSTEKRSGFLGLESSMTDDRREVGERLHVDVVEWC